MEGKVKSYLTKQLVIEKNTVNYRSLSRVLAIHVDEAKEHLDAFAKANPGCHPKYLVHGILKYVPEEGEDWEMIDDLKEEYESSNYAATLTGPDKLESVKATFRHIKGIYVHTLSPVLVTDHALLVGAPGEIVRAADAEGGVELAAKVGRIVGDDVKKAWLKRKSFRPRARAIPAASTSKVAPTEKGKGAATTATAGTTTSTNKPKASGTLNWGKAKVKDAKLQEPVKTPATEKDVKGKKPVNEDATMTDSEPPKEDSKPKHKAPAMSLKRKSEASSMSDTEDTEPPKPTKTAAVKKPDPPRTSKPPKDEPIKPAPPKEFKRRNNIVISDEDEDEEEEEPPRKTTKPSASSKGKRKALAGSDDDDELDKMMNLDDSEVVRSRAPAIRRATTPPDTDGDEPMSYHGESQQMDVDEDMEDEPKPKRKQKVKKVVPVGRNGLKKKRIEKTRTTLDDKGFMVTEDYSEYESVDEEEDEADPKPKKAAAKPKAPPVVKKAAPSKPAPSKPVPKASAASTTKAGQKGIGSFFAKKA